MAERSRRRISTPWRRAACASRSSITRAVAGRRAPRSLPATTRSRCGATPCPACRAATAERDRAGHRYCPNCSGRLATAPTIAASGTWTASRSRAASIAPTASTTTTGIFGRGHRLRTTRPCPQWPRTAVTTRARLLRTRPSASCSSTRSDSPGSRSSSLWPLRRHIFRFRRRPRMWRAIASTTVAVGMRCATSVGSGCVPWESVPVRSLRWNARSVLPTHFPTRWRDSDPVK